MNHIALIDGFEYPISKILNNQIYIINPDNSLSLLIYKNGRWIVDNSNRDHQISFVKFHPFLNLNDDELFKACDNDENHICDDENFWYLRIVQQFGPVTAKYKPPTETYKEQYKVLTEHIQTKILNRYPIMRHDFHPDFALAFVNKEFKSNERNKEYIKKLKKYQPLFEYLMNIDDVDIWNNIKFPIMILITIYNPPKLKNSNILYWMLSDHDIMNDIRVLKSIASYALILGKLDIIEKLSQEEIYPNFGFNEAISHGHIDAIIFLIERRLVNDDAIRSIINALIQYRNEDKLIVYQSLYEHGLLNQEKLDRIKRGAITLRSSDVLLWLKDINQLNPGDLDRRRNLDLERDNLEKLKEWFDFGLFDDRDLEYIISKVTVKQPKILQWLADLP